MYLSKAAWLILVIVNIRTGHGEAATCDEDSWKYFKSGCLAQFLRDTENYDLRELNTLDPAWQDTICLSTVMLHNCYTKRVQPCPHLVDQFTQQLNDSLRLDIKRANSTCFGKNKSKDGCENFQTRQKEIIDCMDEFKRIMSLTTHYMGICGHWNRCVMCHRNNSRQCLPLRNLVMSYMTEHDSIYAKMATYCPVAPDDHFGSPNYQNVVHHRQKRDTVFQEEEERRRMGEKEEEERRKEQEKLDKQPKGLRFWGMIGLSCLLGMAPLSLNILVLYKYNHD